MRNLKRALSLGLTAAMISGLMVMGSSAVSYPDSDQIQNQTAVEILGEIGVMVGDDNGNFNPTQDVTRAEMAVIITRILYGNDLNVDQFKGMNLFTDVPAWAEGFVNLCASLDIVAGVGDGKFAPNETVTAAQAALMLSRALGYFQNNAEFGNDWALAAIRRATSAGIIGDDMVLAANEGLSRDNVAQMTFNTLTKAVPVQYNELLNVYYNENQGITYALTFNYLQTLGYTNFDLVYDNGDTTIYGRPATTWGIGTYRTTTSDKDSGSRYDEALDANGGLISSNVQILSRDEIITVPNEATYVYTDGTAEEDIYDDLGEAVCNDQRGQAAEDEYDWTVYVNGELQDVSDEDAIPAENEGDAYAYTGDGVQTEIYVDDADKTVTVVEINYYLGQVASVDEEEGTVSIRTVSDDAKLDDRTFATTAFEEEDYVVFTIDQNEDDDFYICEMVAPETVDGTVTRVNNNAGSADAYLYLDRETKYDYSDHMAYDLNDENNERHPSLEEAYTLFLDPNGFVLAYSGDTTKSFLYVQDSDEELSDWEARVVLADGTDDVIMVDSDLDHGDRAAVNFDDEDKVEWATEAADLNAFPNWVDSTELDKWDTVRGKITDIDYQIWEYETNADGDLYSLTGRNTRYAEDVEINNGENHIDFINGSGVRSNVSIDDDTIFVDVENNTVYTGRDEVPDVSNADIAYVVEGDHNRDVAEIVYIIDGDIYDADAIFFVLTSADRDTEKYDGDLYFEFDDTYVDGRDRDGLYVSYEALIKAGIASLDEDDEDADQDRDVASEIEDELVGKVIEVRKSTDGTYVTEIRVHNDWDPAVTATRSVLDVADGWLIDNWDATKYNTDSAETTYVVIEEEYNRAKTEVTGYDVSVGGYGDIVEWVDENPTTEDGYSTLVFVAKADDDDAQLVYILRFQPEAYQRTVTITLNGQTIDTQENVWAWDQVIVPDGEAQSELAACAARNDVLTYYYNDDVANSKAFPLDSYIFTDVPMSLTDVTINVVTDNEDILTNGNLTLNTLHAVDGDYDADAGYIRLGANNRINYNFELNYVPGDEIESVTWTEEVYVSYGEGNYLDSTETKTATPNASLKVNGQTDNAYTSADTVMVVITNLQVNGVKPDDPQQVVLNNVTLNVKQPGEADSLRNSGKDYTFEVPQEEYPAARIMTMAETGEPATKWVVNYTESVSVNGGTPVETVKSADIPESGLVNGTIDSVPFDDKDTVVITITINSITEEPVTPEKTTNTLTLQGEGWAEALGKNLSVYDTDGNKIAELTPAPAPFGGETTEWTAEIPAEYVEVVVVANGKNYTIAMDEENVTETEEDLGLAQGDLITISIDGVIVDTVKKGETATLKGLTAGTQYLADQKTGAKVTDAVSEDGTLTVKNTANNRELYTACEVTLPEGVTATLSDGETKVAKYVAKDETIIVTFPADNTYTIGDGEAVHYDTETKVEVQVTGALEIVASQTEEEFVETVETTLSSIKSVEDMVTIAADEDGNVTITLLTEVENAESIDGSGIMTSLAALLTEGYTIRIDVKGGSYAEMTAEDQLTEMELITLLDLPTVGSKDYTVTITSDIDGYAPVVYNVTVTADIGA